MLRSIDRNKHDESHLRVPISSVCLFTQRKEQQHYDVIGQQGAMRSFLVGQPKNKGTGQ